MNLKEFQQRTVRLAVEALTDASGSKRFLVADETGLGKTQIAKGVIGELCRSGKHLEVFYVCSSLTIIHQNRGALLEVLPPPLRHDAMVEVDRLTLLPEATPTRRAPFTLYTLTPGTSVSLGRRTGRADERAVIWRFLCEVIHGLRKQHSLRDTFWRNVGGWDDRVDAVSLAGTSELLAIYRSEVARELECATSPWSSTLINKMKELVQQGRDAELVGRCRGALARAALQKLAPDVIIFDEFQRFFELLGAENDPNEERKDDLDPVARSIMQRLLRVGSQQTPAVLLLSATPYRLFTSWKEGSGEHYRQFLELLRFLHGRKARHQVTELERVFREYRMRLARDPTGSREVMRVRDDLKIRLRAVMCRTERPQTVAGRRRVPMQRVEAPLAPMDIRVYRHLHESAKPEDRSAAAAYWASIPYPLQAMDQAYVLSRDSRPVKLEGEARNARLTWPDIRRFKPALHPHPRLRCLDAALPPALLALPWLPPTWKWWPLGGAFADASLTCGETPSKALVFSHFRAVPRALAATLSYGAERRCYSAARQKAARLRAVAYEYRTETGQSPASGLRKRPSPSFTFPIAAKQETGLRTLLMFLPTPALAAIGDPLPLAAKNSKLRMADALRRAEQGLREKLGEGPDRRRPSQPWAWAAALERKAQTWRWYDAALRSLLSQPSKLDAGEESLARGLVAAIETLRSIKTPSDHPSRRELHELARIAVLGPGNVLYRAATRVFGDGGVSPVRVRRVAEVGLFGLRPYLDAPELHVLFRTREEPHHGAAILRAVWDGNLESVLDEQLAVLRGLGSSRVDVKAERNALSSLLDALRLGVASVTIRETGNAAEREPFRMRCHAAMALGAAQERETGEGELRSADRRVAFNSPFKPHVLATTSIGQEGLDFHVWARHVIHWDLPSNPVDLEQRDGRVDRYGCLAVRQALASKAGALPATASPWRNLADAIGEGAEGLSPWWVYEGAEIRRTVFVPPFSRLDDDLDALLSQQSLYRLALGQPDQEALLRSLERRIDDAGQNEQAVLDWLDEAQLDLSPSDADDRTAMSSKAR